jgi:hypothetical protein
MLRQVEGARTLACELRLEPEANPRLDALTPELVELWRRTLLTVPRSRGKAHGNNRHTAKSRTPLGKRGEIDRADAKDAELRAELEAACARRELSRPSAEARFAEDRVPRMAVVTVEKHVARLKQAFGLARKRGRFAGPNLCDDVEPLDRAQIDRLEQERRHPGRMAWEPERLVADLDGAVHTGSTSVHRRGDRGDVIIRDSLHGVFLLCWLAGLRLREALQLRCADLVRVHGVWCVDVQAGPGQRLKNAHSRRRIPLHRFLRELASSTGCRPSAARALGSSTTATGSRPRTTWSAGSPASSRTTANASPPTPSAVTPTPCARGATPGWPAPASSSWSESG